MTMVTYVKLLGMEPPEMVEAFVLSGVMDEKEDVLTLAVAGMQWGN